MKKMLATIILTLITTAPLFAQAPHDADTNGDFVISHEEMLRVTELWKTGAYHIDSNGNFVPGSGKRIITVKLALPADAKPLEMVLIDPGTFMMGSPSTEIDRRTDERQHEVTLTKEFYIGKYEVTQGQWTSVMGSNPTASYIPKGPNYPQDNVSWNDTQNFLKKLNEMGQGHFRLPTEAEWEYACRAGTTTRFYWGDDYNEEEIDNYAWYQETRLGTGTDAPKLSVGTKLPNPWGLFDMSGSRREWCQDWKANYPGTPQTDPVGPETGTAKVTRGGSWFSDAFACRSAVRYHSNSPNSANFEKGFRIVRTP